MKYIELSFPGKSNRPPRQGSKGTYVLILELPQSRRIKIGKLGIFHFDKGCYCYVGSAFGPGGLRPRTDRHRKRSKKLRWHIDYLRRYCRLVEIWYASGSMKQECPWVSKLNPAQEPRAVPVPGFGSSDCKCASHLFYHPQSYQSWYGLLRDTRSEASQKFTEGLGN